MQVYSLMVWQQRMITLMYVEAELFLPRHRALNVQHTDVADENEIGARR